MIENATLLSLRAPGDIVGPVAVAVLRIPEQPLPAAVLRGVALRRALRER